MIPSGMNMNATPRLPVTRYVAAWPPATAVRGADAATMKNTRSGTPSARRCSLAVSLPAGAAGGAVWAIDMDSLLLLGLTHGAVEDLQRLELRVEVQRLVAAFAADPRDAD